MVILVLLISSSQRFRFISRMHMDMVDCLRCLLQYMVFFKFLKYVILPSVFWIIKLWPFSKSSIFICNGKINW